MSPKLPVVKARDVLRALRKAGFSHDRTTGSHYILIHAEDPGRQVSIPFHAGKDIKTRHPPSHHQTSWPYGHGV
jgi:predicted RNA binding protein YcfA (HicA-like mRNA interferase family)